MRNALRKRAVLPVALAAVAASVIVPVVAVGTVANADPTALGSVDMGSNSRLSAAIYDPKGQLVRHLYELAPRTGTVTLRWDGKDDRGDDLPAGDYNWRAVTSGITGADDGGVGDGGRPAPGFAYEASDDPGEPSAVTYGPDGGVYVQSAYEEGKGQVVRYAPANLSTGRRTWDSADGFKLQGTAMAVDDQYAYVAAHADAPHGYDYTHYRIFRLNAQTGKAADWTDATGGASILAANWTPGGMPVTGLAADATYLWVADATDNRIEVFTKADGRPAPLFGGQNWLALDDPRGIATDGANRFWIVTGDHAERFVYDATKQTLRSETRTPALDRPYGLAWSRVGGQSTLYVSEIGGGHVRKYDVTGDAPVESAVWFASMSGGGAVTDTTFGWKYDNLSDVPNGNAPIAVSPDGKTLAATDLWNGRTMFYDTTNGNALPGRLQGLNQPSADMEPTPAARVLVSMGREYNVNYLLQDADGVRLWQLAANWLPTDDPGRQCGVVGTIIRSLGGNQYEYVFCGQNSKAFPWGGILVYRLNSDGPGAGMKRVAQIKADSPPPAWVYDTTVPKMEITTDANGDGTLDANDPAETEKTNYKGYNIGNPFAWVDDQGTIWFASAGTIGSTQTSFGHSGVGRLPLRTIDGKANPVYKLDDFTLATEFDGDPAGSHEVSGTQVKYDRPNNRLFTEVATGEFDPFSSGNGVLMEDLRTKQRSLFSGRAPFSGAPFQPRDSVGAMAVDTSGGYFYTGGSSNGSGQRVTMYTWDGLAVAQASSDVPTYGPGSFIQGMSMAAFTYFDGTHYVYTADVGYGRAGRFAFTGVNTVQRSGSDPSANGTSGSFTWPGTGPANGLLAWWRFDNGTSGPSGPGGFIQDASGNGHWGVLLGNGAAPSGLWQPDGGVRGGAITLDGRAAGGVQLGKNTWSPAPDNVVDGQSGSSALTVASWIKTTGSGVVVGYQDTYALDGAIINPPVLSQVPGASVPLLYVGQNGLLYGGTNTTPGCAQARSTAPVNDGRWHHVALTVAPADPAHPDVPRQTLYVDGAVAGSTNCAMTGGGLGFTTLGLGYTSDRNGAAAWPSTPGGYFHFTGSLDDTRIYGRTLPATDVRALATAPAPRGPLAEWRFDETSGTTAVDATDHGKDVTVTGGTRVPTGGPDGSGALAFDGTTTRVNLPREMAELGSLSVAVWVKTTKGGVVLGDERAPYPHNMVSGSGLAGFGDHMSSKLLSIDPDGTARSALLGQPLGGPGKSPNLLDGSWHQITVTAERDGGPINYRMAMYVDGKRIDGFDGEAELAYIASFRGNDQLGVGRDSDGDPWTFYSGQLDDVRVYDRGLSAGEVCALYSTRACG